MKEYNIASIPGDGIGKEVVPEGLKVLKDAAKKHQFKINFTEYDFASCDCLLYTSPSPRDLSTSRMPSSA